MKKIVLLILILLMSSCQKQPTALDLSLLDYKQPFLLPATDLDNINITTPTAEELNRLKSYQTLPMNAFDQSTQACLDDLEQLRWMIRTFYGKYPIYQLEYEQAFEQIQQAIQNTQTVSRQDWVKILLKAFSFDLNSHFKIDGYPLSRRKTNFYDLENTYLKQGQQFIHQETKDILKNPQYLVPFLNDEAEVVYHEMNNPETPFPVKEERIKEPRLTLEEDILIAHQYEINEHENKIFDDFARKANKKTSISILDLRDNSGGIENYPGSFFMLLTNDYPVTSHIGYVRLNPDLIYASELELLRNTNNLFPSGNHLEYQASDAMLPGQGLIIVLQNQATLSGAERLIDLLHHLDNTLFIGTPSGGSYTSNSFGELYYLQKSGVTLSFGPSYLHFNPDYFQEGIGFKPDLYVLDQDMKVIINSLLRKIQH